MGVPAEAQNETSVKDKARRRGNAVAARAAGLRHVSDSFPGMTRRRTRRGYSYFHPNGRRVTDPSHIRRINALAIPPAYTEVWISPDPRGHIQATGRDARGRKQYRYHP